MYKINKFLYTCNLEFKANPSVYVRDLLKVLFTSIRLKGTPLKVQITREKVTRRGKTLQVEFKRIIRVTIKSQRNYSITIAKKYYRLKQGNRSIVQYSADLAILEQEITSRLLKEEYRIYRYFINLNLDLYVAVIAVIPA